MAGPYELYLIRHGIAEPRGEKWPDDDKRPLTDDGMARLRKSIRGLVRAGLCLDVVLTSPLVRTRQTAEIVAAEVTPRPHVVAIDSLKPDGSYQGVMADLEAQLRRNKIALVGHEPGIGDLAARMAGSRHPFPFKKGGVCRIDVSSLPLVGPGDIKWFLPPRLLLALKR